MRRVVCFNSCGRISDPAEFVGAPRSRGGRKPLIPQMRFMHDRAILFTWAGKWKRVACHGFLCHGFLSSINAPRRLEDRGWLSIRALLRFHVLSFLFLPATQDLKRNLKALDRLV